MKKVKSGVVIAGIVGISVALPVVFYTFCQTTKRRRKRTHKKLRYRRKIIDLRKFKVSRVLSKGKELCVILGEIGGVKTIIFLSLTRKLEETSELEEIFRNIEVVKFNSVNQNSITGVAQIQKSLFHISFIYGATNDQILQFTQSKWKIFEETPDVYVNVTRRILNKSSTFNDTKWMDNILEGKSEKNEVLYSGRYFLTVRNIHTWKDESDVQQMDYLVILKDKNVGTLRELRKKHVNLLKNIRDVNTIEIIKRHRITTNDIRMFIHYLPSYNRLHIHISHVCIFNRKSTCGRAHLLNDVIDNLQKFDDYYMKKNITILFNEENKVYKKLKDEGY